VDIGAVTIDDFAGRVGEVFTVDLHGAGSLELTLAEVETTPAAAALEGHRIPFSLILHGPLEPVLNQGIQSFTHPELGAAGIFVVPLGPEGGAMRYQIVIS
jgi:hypothetical protein